MQEVLMYITVGLAVLFLVRKFVFTPKKKKGCDPDCGCS